MFQFVSDRLGKRSAVTVLEFGVDKEKSMEMWSSMNSNSLSKFFGLDSFEGLPETWDKDRKKGCLIQAVFRQKSGIPELDL